MRRIAGLDFASQQEKEIEKTKKELDDMRFELGGDYYLDKIKAKGNHQKEVIIAIENIK